MRGLAKKIISAAMSAALVLSVFGGADAAMAKKKQPSLPKKMTVKVKQVKKLTIKNISKSKIKKTKWTVSSKNLSLSKGKKTSAKIRGIKSGKAEVKAVVRMKKGKKKYTLKTTVTVEGAKATDKPGKSAGAVSAAPSGSTGPASASAAPSTEPSAPASASAVPVDYTIMEKLPDPKNITRSVDPPDLMTMLDGSKVETKEQWAERRREIKAILQRYFYGIWRDGGEEAMKYSLSGSQMTMTITRGTQSASFKASVSKPSGTAPEGGWPVIISVGAMDAGFCKQKGYAVITFEPTNVAADSKSSRKGAFYTLYPYDKKDWKEQTGSAMAWGWGVSKIVDALAGGAGAELDISPVNTIVTGVSRYGKAAAAAGAFDERIKVSMPVCSGYGGMTMLRYGSNGLTYNLLPEFANDPKKDDVADLAAWKSTGGNESIGSLSSNGWFASTLDSFKNYQELPFDAHFTAALSAGEGRYLFIVTGINSDMWSSPPGFWWTYQLAKPAFDLMGVSDHEAIQMHLNLHGIETEDLCKLFAFTDHHMYGKTTDPSTFPAPWNELLKDFTLDSLKTCIFASEANQEAFEAGKPIDPSTLPPNPDVKVNMKVKIDGASVDTVVSRSSASDALLSELEGDDAGKGFNFLYGPLKEYGWSYAHFKLMLPKGKSLSDYSSVTFTCQTDSNYYGKRMGLVVNPASAGMPEEIDYNYNSGAVSAATNVSGGQDFPNNTSSPQQITLPIDAMQASLVDGEELECSIYIHMECGEGKASYTIKDIQFNS